AIVLGLPGIAVSQQSSAQELDFRPGGGFDFRVAASFAARLVAELESVPLPSGTLLNVNAPGCEPAGAGVARLRQRGRGDEPERVVELRRQLEYHGHRYYVLDDPEIGDDQYDALLDELRAIETEHPELVTPDSPTQRIGGEPVSDLVKVRHPQQMLSLANARSEEELRAWIQRMRNFLSREGIADPAFEFVAEPKIDALAISL